MPFHRFAPRVARIADTLPVRATRTTRGMKINISEDDRRTAKAIRRRMRATKTVVTDLRPLLFVG